MRVLAETHDMPGAVEYGLGTLLAPNIIDDVLNGKQAPEVTLARVLEPFPVDWRRQLA